MLIDSHSHIYQKDFDEDIDEVIQRAQEAGISCILLPNIDQESIAPMHTLCQRYPKYCLPMMGLHPTSVTEHYLADLALIDSHLQQNNYLAVGEIGIDLYWDTSFFSQQQQAFEQQLLWSIQYDLPVVIHNREAFDPIIACIKKVGASKLRGVFHSFGGSKQELDTILALGDFYVGINGIVTFKNSKLSESLQHCPPERILIETDAPYLAPTPYRGKRNEPAYLVQTAKKVAEILQLPLDEFATSCANNTEKLFEIKRFLA